jgi:tRNA(Ile)-lysidine synthase
VTPTHALDLLAPYRSLLLAVSGGPDSVALMLLCADWPDRVAHEIAVATVDHGLRTGARAEAEQVADWAQKLGFTHHLLGWIGEKPATRIQERARDARYGLLADCARDIGADAVVTAHHADDQAETILFRLTRGSGVAGLSGMAPVARCGGAALLRPLLGWRKSALVSVCEAAKHPFFTDPSNANEIFARARLRRLAPALAEMGLDTDGLLRLGARAARADAALDACSAELRARAVIGSDAETARFDAGALGAAPLELLLRLVAAEVQRLAPQAQIRLERLERAAAALSEALRSGKTLRLTLAGLILESACGVMTLRPAPRRRTPPPEAGGCS